MVRYTQENRPLQIRTPLEPNTLLLEKFSGREALSELFCFELELLAQQPVPFERVLGQPVEVQISLTGQTPRIYSGLIRRLRQGISVAGPNGKQTFIRYRAEMVPSFWRLTQRVQNRVFQRKHIIEILQQLLKAEWKLNVVFELSGRRTYVPHNYCVQYQESDFHFASRLMEEEGLYYFFRHGESGHQLVIRDDSLLSPELPGASVLSFDEEGSQQGAKITQWEKEQTLCPGKYTLWDYSFELPEQNLASERSVANEVMVGQVKHSLNLQGQEQVEIFEYPAGHAHRFDGVSVSGKEESRDFSQLYSEGTAMARLRSEQQAAQALRIEGRSNATSMLPGHRFKLERHFDGNGDYLLTAVEHSASQEGTFLAEPNGTAFTYSNNFQAIPLELPYRPSRTTPRPRIDGYQTAIVVGMNEDKDEIFCDKYGRVKVQFHWDREGKTDANSSCWVRVAQVWAGKTFGAIHIPRVGQEVVVAFRNGNPDEPLIVGSLYNAENPPPYTLPECRTLSGFKTHTPEGKTTHFSGLLFDDAAGNEQTVLRAQKDLLLSAGNHAVISARGNLDTYVAGYYQEHLGGKIPGAGTGSGSGGGPDPSKPGDGTTDKPKTDQHKTDKPKTDREQWEEEKAKTDAEKKKLKADAEYAASRRPAWRDFSNASDTVTFTGQFHPTLKMTMGFNAKTDVGLNFSTGFGGNVKVDVNPFAFLGAMDSKWPWLAKAFATPWTALTSGGLDIKLGAAGSKFSIGPGMGYSRGTEIKFNGGFPDENLLLHVLHNKTRDLAAFIVSSAIAGTMITTQALIGLKDTRAHIGLGIANGLVGAATAVFVLAELLIAERGTTHFEKIKKEKEKEKSKEPSEDVLKVTKLCDDLQKSWQDTLESVKKQDQKDSTTSKKTDSINVCDGNFSYTSNKFSVACQGKDSLICLEAVGEGGTAQLLGRRAGLSGGVDGVRISNRDTAGKIEIDSGKDKESTIILKHGKVQIEISAKGITIDGDEENVMVSSKGGIGIKASNYIRLMVNDSTELTLDPDGFTFKGQNFVNRCQISSKSKGMKEEIL